MGGLAGGVEFLLLIPSHGFDRSEMPVVVLTYGLFWSLVGGGYGLVRCLAGRRASSGRLFLEASVLTVVGTLLMVLFEQASATWFSSPLASGALLTEFGIVAVLLGALWWLPRASQRALQATASVLALSALALGLVACKTSWPWWRAPVAMIIDRETPRHATPNVLILLVDTLRADHLGAYGYWRDTSPAIDRFAAEAVRFDQCLATSSWTKPATASLLTGLFPASHRQHTDTSVLPAGVPMLPGAMGEYGYRTAYIVTNPFAAESFGFGQEVDLYREARWLPVHGETSLFFTLNELEKWLPRDRVPKGALTEVFRLAHFEWFGFERGRDDAAWANEMLLDWIDSGGEEPFFAYVHYFEPHEPYDPTPEFRRRFVDPDYQGPALAAPPGLGLYPVKMVPVERAETLPDAQQKHLVDLYDAEIAEFDASFAELIGSLRNRGLYDNTLILLTSDHGEEFYEHLTWRHRTTPFHSQLHVPMILKLPRQESAGLVIEGLCRQIDVVPSLLALLDLPRWPGLQGVDLSDSIRRGTTPLETRWSVAETYEGDDRYASAYIEDELKLIYVNAGREAWLLFDLAKDPEEQESLDAQRVSDLERMKHELRVRIDNLARLSIESKERELSEEEIRRLEALGYLAD